MNGDLPDRLSWESAIRPQLLERLTRPLWGGGVIGGELAHGIYSRLERTRNIHPLTARFLDRPSPVRPASGSRPRVFARRSRDADVARSRDGESLSVDETPSMETVRSTRSTSNVASPTVRRSPVSSPLSPPTGDVLKPGETGQSHVETSPQSRSLNSDANSSRSPASDRTSPTPPTETSSVQPTSQGDRAVRPQLSEPQKNEIRNSDALKPNAISSSDVSTKSEASNVSFTAEKSPNSSSPRLPNFSKVREGSEDLVKPREPGKNDRSLATFPLAKSSNSDANIFRSPASDRTSPTPPTETTFVQPTSQGDRAVRPQLSEPQKNEIRNPDALKTNAISSSDVSSKPTVSPSSFTAQKSPASSPPIRSNRFQGSAETEDFVRSEKQSQNEPSIETDRVTQKDPNISDGSQNISKNAARKNPALLSLKSHTKFSKKHDLELIKNPISQNIHFQNNVEQPTTQAYSNEEARNEEARISSKPSVVNPQKQSDTTEQRSTFHVDRNLASSQNQIVSDKQVSESTFFSPRASSHLLSNTQDRRIVKPKKYTGASQRLHSISRKKSENFKIVKPKPSTSYPLREETSKKLAYPLETKRLARRQKQEKTNPFDRLRPKVVYNQNEQKKPISQSNNRKLKNSSLVKYETSTHTNNISRSRDRLPQKLTVVKPVNSAVHRTIETQIQKMSTSTQGRSSSSQARESPIPREQIFRAPETESTAVPPSNSDEIDLEEITEKVLRKLRRDLIIERERRGQF
ncbi:putative cell-wall-anchored protein SasA (LPXTG motif) [Geitlerinema sp. FC II]|nr:putative cell-wall-anchored protein SasA (LPXTG motif) [Geitlerinema sp. FC II]